jgi:lipopolysaccharide/colanic/teichoic acid biosynthesis glycosyltransferase
VLRRLPVGLLDPRALVFGRPLSGRAVDDTLKRLFDVTAAVGLSLVAAPLMLLCALAVKLDSPGAVFYRQERVGRTGRLFMLTKFRTMRADAERDGVPVWAQADDDRVTRVGRLLRKTRMDELPQVFNVLLGDMSLVGPRPTSFGAETYRLWHTARLEVKPGLTGLWQVSGRADLDFDDRLRLDIAYIRNRSLLLDAWILVRTFTAVLSTRGAA